MKNIESRRNSETNESIGVEEISEVTEIAENRRVTELMQDEQAEQREKLCPVCGERVIGRIDKIFCSDECRTFYNNKKKRELRQKEDEQEVILCCRGCNGCGGGNSSRNRGSFLLKIWRRIGKVFKNLFQFI
ncbi:MAG: DUF2116 family Zn-ribbon domain-containing protein [Bacteroidales bacterium]|nr:DUF2116 family Zn-ribbon domain-containing protein [Bacteroidales bacterium]